MTDQFCIHCLRHASDTRPWCPDNPGSGCTYGLGHEYPLTEEAKPKQPPRKQDKQLCMKCGLHVRNPTSAQNGCTHEYPV
jgi:ribosomal protein L40E